MGNDIQIKDLDLRSTSFLPSEIRDIDGITDIYSLEDEFAKTKKNKNLVLYLSILLFFAVVVGSAFIFSVYIQNKNKSVDINISEFEDLRLKEVIDSARSHENNLDLLLIKLEILKVDHKKQVLEVQEKYYQRELNLIAQELPRNQTDQRLQQIRTAEQREIAAVNRSFEKEIAAKTKEIDDIEEELAQKKLEEEQTEKSASVSNVDRLNALKMEELKKSNDSGVVSLREYYEKYVNYLVMLYNPSFQSPRIRSILDSNQRLAGNDKNGFHPIYQQEGIINAREYNAIHTKSADNQFLLERLQRIPFKNSVGPALAKVDAYTNSIEGNYEELLGRFADTLIYKNSIISEYQDALNSVLSDRMDNGYIINSQDSDNLHVHVNIAYPTPTDATAIVFREDDEYIGKIQFIKLDRNDVIRAKVIDLARGKSIKPFDKILLELN